MSSTTHRAVSPVVALSLAVLGQLMPSAAGVARAEGKRSPPAPQEGRPWEAGSTQAQRDRAHQLFSAGNDLFFKRDYTQAIERYQQALEVFDHPRIRLALARALLRLGRPAEAHPHLEHALRWGQAPLDADEHAEALDHRAALANQVSVLVVRCRTEGARLTLDGKDVAPCPGQQRHVVMPGRHQVVGKKPGFLPFTGETVADAGQETVLEVELRTLEAAAVARRRWATWKPWAVIGGGAVLALGGVPFRVLATRNIDRFQTSAEGVCGPAGCEPGTPAYQEFQALEPIEARAKLQNGVAISLWVLGGVVATTGLVAVILNRERIVIPQAEGLVVTPVVADDVVGVGVFGEF